MHQGRGHLLLVLDTDHRFQHGAQQGVVAGDVLPKFFVLLHGQDGDGLVTGFDPDGGAPCLAFVGCGGAHWVPFLHKLAPCHAGRGDVDQAHVIVLVLFLFLLHVLVDVNRDALDVWETVELKVLPPEDVICFCFAGGAGKEGVIKAQLTEVFLLGGQVLGLYDPEAKHVLSSTAIVLCRRKRSVLMQNP